MVAAFGYSNQSKIFQEITSSKFQGNMLRNSVSVDTKVYVLQIMQKSTSDVFHKILGSFRTASFDNNLGGLLLKRKQEEKDAK